jgi:hypothetical protein
MESGGESTSVSAKVVVTRHPGVPPSEIEQTALDEKVQVEQSDAGTQQVGGKKSLEKNQVLVGEAKPDKPLNNRRRPITSAYNSKITF